MRARGVSEEMVAHVLANFTERPWVEEDDPNAEHFVGKVPDGRTLEVVVGRTSGLVVTVCWWRSRQ
jgi:hypothetical protein